MRIALGQFNQLTDEKLQFARQLGISGVQMNLLGHSSLPGEQQWEYEDLLALRLKTEEYGLTFEALENVPLHFYDKVMLGLPGRDEQIEHYCATIRNMGRAGIPILGYHFMPNSVWRTSRTAPGRGGAHVTAFDMARVEQTAPAERRQYVGVPGAVLDDIFTAHLAPEQEVTAAQMWENYSYFMNAVLPVAEASGVTLALHPDDPPVESLGGVARIFKSVDDFKHGYEIASGSPAWALDLCLGCCSEMPGGAANVRAMIEFFGPKGRIAYVHFRDVQGTVPQFAECFIGEGNYNAAETMLLLKRNGFTGFLLDDHVPHMVDDSPYGHRGRAHAIGYMQGLLDAIEAFGK
ncbi:MAG: mannonate dehydratase [Thermomicrobia bacterium]|nr:mannonate dehydratase [Thermomicrobia bacterium]MCA1723090.1 mannonate dehydratase [Thermomicrobia bacterium]